MPDEDPEDHRDDERVTRVRVDRGPDVVGDGRVVGEQGPALEGEQKRDGAEQRGHGPGKDVNIFSWTVTALFGAITLLLAFESWALLTNHTPITDYIRPAIHAYPGYAFVIAVVFGILVGHFLWGPAYGRTSPVGKK